MSARSTLIVYGWIVGISCIFLFAQVVLSIVIVSKKGNTVEEIAAYYYFICTLLFISLCVLHCCGIASVFNNIFPAWYTVTNCSIVLGWIICWIYMTFISKSLQTMIYPIVSICMFGSEFLDFLLIVKTLSRTGTNEEITRLV
jgi:hypothetical protein